jgi:flagellar motor protein MotB
VDSVETDWIPGQARIAELLKMDPGLSIYVVGHTDDAGDFEANMALSKASAATSFASRTRPGFSSQDPAALSKSLFFLSKKRPFSIKNRNPRKAS